MSKLHAHPLRRSHTRPGPRDHHGLDPSTSRPGRSRRTAGYRASRLSAVVAGLVLVLAGLEPAHAGGTRKKVIRGYDALDAGESHAAAIDGRGKVTVGYLDHATEIADTTTAFRCTSSGGRSYVGTSDPATVARVSLDPKTGAPRVRKLADLPGVAVSALARHPNGDILAATLPGGDIHRINAKGKVTSFAKLEVAQIWDIAVRGSEIYVATGPRGELYSIDLGGRRPKIVLDVPEKHIMDVDFAGKTVLAATAPSARIYTTGKTREGLLLHDFPGDELRALELAGQHLYAAVNTFESRGVTSLQSLTKRLNRSSLSGEGASKTSVEATPPKASAKVYRVDLGRKLDADRISDAPWQLVLSRGSQYLTALEATASGDAVLTSSSLGGKIYRVADHRHISTVADFEQRQATDLCRISATHFLGTAGDGAAVHALELATGNRARYTSKVLDLERPSQLGKVALRGSGALTLRVRTGPSKEIDDRWSRWRKITLSESPVAHSGVVGGERRRYVQFEIELGSAASQLRAIELFYGPENIAPMLEKVSVRPPSFSSSDNSEPSSRALVKWRASARDDDPLQYEVKIRPEGGNDDDWVALTTTGPTTKSELGIDLDTLADGVYEIGVQASDEPANGSARAEYDELVSDPFRIDRSRPEFITTRIEGRKIHGEVRDAGSRIYDVAYSIDGQRFRNASPSDGLFDDNLETFDLQLPKLDPGVHRVVLRARDAHGNFATRALRVRTR